MQVTPLSFLLGSLTRCKTFAGTFGLGALLLVGTVHLSVAADLAKPAAADPASSQAQNPPPVITTPSGLQYQDIKVGTGMPAKLGARVSVHYTGWLRNRDGSAGKKFDSSRDSGQAFQFDIGIGQVIAGWDEGVQGMKVGGIRRLMVPAALGYGAEGSGSSIPPNAKLLFEVELLNIQ